MQWDAKRGEWRYPGRPVAPPRKRRPDPVVDHKPKPPTLEKRKPPKKAKKASAAIATPATPPKPTAPATPIAGATLGQLSVLMRIDGYPANVRTMPNQWKQFDVDCGPGWVFTVTLRPRVFAAFEEARAAGVPWGAAITGKIGARMANGYALDQPAAKVFTKQTAPKAEEASPSAPEAPQTPSESVSASPAPTEPQPA